MHGYKGDEENFFSYMEKNTKNSPTGILTLPYFSGASTPYQDLGARGAILNLSTETTDVELYQSLMEGTAMEMRLNLDVVKEYGIQISRVVATGGGANSARWMQIKADVARVEVETLRSSEGGLCGLAMLQAVALGALNSLEEAREVFVRYEGHFTPSEGAPYEEHYEKYKKLYHTLKEFM